MSDKIEAGDLRRPALLQHGKRRDGQATGSRAADAEVLANSGIMPTTGNLSASGARAVAASPITALTSRSLADLTEMIAEHGPRAAAQMIGVGTSKLVLFMQSDPTRAESYNAALRAASSVMSFDSIDVLIERKYNGKTLADDVDQGKLSSALRHASAAINPAKANGEKPLPVIIASFEEIIPGSVSPSKNKVIDTGTAGGHSPLSLGDGSVIQEV